MALLAVIFGLFVAYLVTTLFIAQGAGHSDSSHQAGYKAAVKAFLDRHKADGRG